MREDFVHYLWRFARFDLLDLKTTQGVSITIQDFGEYNRLNAGPDFHSAQLRIDEMHWAGHVEMHLRSSDWFAHGHHQDPAYDNVILHVVLEEDEPAINTQGRRIPCLELTNRIPAGLAKTYWRLMNNSYWIPCQNQLGTVSDLHLKSWLDRLVVERLEVRAGQIGHRLEINKNDWEATFYERLARSLGGRINDEGMDMLARSAPLKIALKHKNSLMQLEALYFGQSGLLQTAPEDDPYVARLKAEYKLLAHKYSLKALPVTAWRYLRLRPNNFPTIRIAQLATLIYQSGQLFSKVLVAADLKELSNTFDVKVSHYWRDHYRFGKTAKASNKRLGKDALRSLFVNAVAPVYLLYGQMQGDDRYLEKATHLLEQLPPEKNATIKKWSELGLKSENAADTQALLQLKRSYCDQNRCLDCALGCRILSRPEPLVKPYLSLNEEAQLYEIAKSA